MFQYCTFPSDVIAGHTGVGNGRKRKAHDDVGSEGVEMEGFPTDAKSPKQNCQSNATPNGESPFPSVRK
jgi:hypothetical protein